MGSTTCLPRRSRADSLNAGCRLPHFRSVNADFKRLVTDWQLKGEKPTYDAEYDAAVLSASMAYRRVGPIIGTVAMQLPRLSKVPVCVRRWTRSKRATSPG